MDLPGIFCILPKALKLYFEKNERLLDENDWGRVQANSRNTFCKVFGNNFLTPIHSCIELGQEVETLKSKLFELKEERRKSKADEENEPKKPRFDVNVDSIVGNLLNELFESVSLNSPTT